jgi:DNA modification methylase
VTSWQVLEGDCRASLLNLPAQSVQTCVTSPPYFGLRDYGTGAWEGGDHACDHVGAGRPSDAIRWDGTLDGAGDRPRPMGAPHRGGQPSVCRCGARRVDAQIGLEPTPDDYVAELVSVFREVRRVLADDGTLWLNLGDSYCAAASGARGSERERAREGWDGAFKVPSLERRLVSSQGADRRVLPDLKQKDLIGIPWMVAFALRADGWFLRSDIIWAKPNPMPESVTDRPTKAHEYLFLLSKSPRYFYDADAIAEPVEWGNHPRTVFDNGPQQTPPGTPSHAGLRKWPGIGAPTAGAREATSERGHDEREDMEAKTTRNKRSVWTVTTKPYAGAHFATFPPKLIEPCILAGSREGDSVLDPFAGAGTTGVVALRRNRAFVGLELNPEYAELARNRIRDDRAAVERWSGGSGMTALHGIRRPSADTTNTERGSDA